MTLTNERAHQADRIDAIAAEALSRILSLSAVLLAAMRSTAPAPTARAVTDAIEVMHEIGQIALETRDYEAGEPLPSVADGTHAAGDDVGDRSVAHVL